MMVATAAAAVALNDLFTIVNLSFLVVNYENEVVHFTSTVREHGKSTQLLKEGGRGMISKTRMSVFCLRRAQANKPNVRRGKLETQHTRWLSIMSFFPLLENTK